MRKSLFARFIFMCLLAVLISFSPSQAAEKFPSRPISILTGTGPGGSVDLSIRALAEPASKKLGQPIIVVNKPGAGGGLMMNELKVTRPDGYTVGTLTGGTIITSLMHKVSYHPVNDFIPILRYTNVPAGLLVLPSSPFKTFKDLITYAKDNPNKVKYATSGVGYPQHLVMLRLEEIAKVEWTNIPFNSAPEAMTALLGGHVDCFSSTSFFVPFVDSGRVRLLATYDEKRMGHYPNVPTLGELGYDVAKHANNGYFVAGPKGLPKDRLKILHDAFYEGMQNPNFKKGVERLDMPPAYQNPEDSKKAIEDMFVTAGDLIRKLQKK